MNYFEFSKAVVLKYSIGENIDNSNISNLNLTSFDKLKSHILLNSVFHFFYIQILITFLLLLFTISQKNYQKLFNTSFLLSIICILSVSISILITGAIYRHYFIPLVPLSSILVGSIFIIVKDKILNSKINKLAIYFLSFIFLVTFVFEKEKFYAKKIKKTAYTKEELNFYSPRLLDYLRPINESLYIWGWNPQLYVLSNLYPSARATISQKNIQNYSNKEYFDDRLLNELKINKPDIIFDYVKPKSFLYTDKNKGIKYSILKDLIDLEYINIDNSNSDCPDLYVEKNNYKELKKKIINFTFTDARLKKINNFSITKEICDDSVLFDESYEDNIVLKFDNKSRVKTILILSSHLNDKKIQMNVKLVNKKEVYLKDIILKKYPFWTEIAISNDNPMSELVLEISNLKKFKYGINEIKVYKD